MDLHPLQSRHLDLSNLPLDRVAASTQIDQKEKINQVSRAFEAVLLRQILQETQKPAFKSKLEGNTATDGIYRDMVTNQLAESISKSGSFGLAKSLAGDLQRQTGAAKSHAHNAAAQPMSAASLHAASVRGRETRPELAGQDAKNQPHSPRRVLSPAATPPFPPISHE